MAAIERIETIRLEEAPNVLWVQVTDADGATGLGETYYLPAAVEAVVHDLAAPLLLGRSALDIEAHAQTLFACANFSGWAGAEMRAFSALDVALWDLAARRAGVSVATLLGGRVRDDVRAYNTCVDAGPHADQAGFVERPGELAHELLEAGFTAMKVWPWDRFAPQIRSSRETGPAGWSAMGPVGHDLTAADLRAGLACVEAIREAVGDRVDVMIEGHGRWDLDAALRICRALEPYEVAWAEDLMQPDSPRDLARLARGTSVTQAVSERLIGRHAYREALAHEAARVVMVDVVWTGGLTEARKIADLADLHHLPLTPHDCTGPVSLAAGLQLCGYAASARAMEVVRGFLAGWYADVVTAVPEVRDGRAAIPDRPGLGLELQPDVGRRPGAHLRRSQR